MVVKTVGRVAAAIVLMAVSAGQSVWAALPTPVAPSTAPAAGDWIALIKGYIKDGGLVLGLAIAVLGFLWIAYLGFSKFNAEIGLRRSSFILRSGAWDIGRRSALPQ